jgi:hypothetical protein
MVAGVLAEIRTGYILELFRCASLLGLHSHIALLRILHMNVLTTVIYLHLSNFHA